MQKWPYVESAPENIIPDNFHDKCSNRLCLKNSPCSVLRELCDDPVAAEEEGEEGAGQDAGHRGRHQAQRQPHALLNRLRLTDLRYFPTTAEYHFSFLYCSGGTIQPLCERVYTQCKEMQRVVTNDCTTKSVLRGKVYNYGNYDRTCHIILGIFLYQ